MTATVPAVWALSAKAGVLSAISGFSRISSIRIGSSRHDVEGIHQNPEIGRCRVLAKHLDREGVGPGGQALGGEVGEVVLAVGRLVVVNAASWICLGG